MRNENRTLGQGQFIRSFKCYGKEWRIPSCGQHISEENCRRLLLRVLSFLSDEPHRFDKDTIPGCGKAGSLIPGILGVRVGVRGGGTDSRTSPPPCPHHQALSLILMDVLHRRFVRISPGLLGFEAHRTPQETTYTPSLGSTHWVSPSAPPIPPQQLSEKGHGRPTIP